MIEKFENTLPSLMQHTNIKQSAGRQVSIYGKGQVDKDVWGKASIVIKKTYPLLSNDFISVLYERMQEHEFTNERCLESIKHVIDNCVYPTPTIANFVSFDKHIELLTYPQMLKKNDELQGRGFKYYSAVDFGLSKPLYTSNVNVEKYKLKRWTTR